MSDGDKRTSATCEPIPYLQILPTLAQIMTSIAESVYSEHTYNAFVQAATQFRDHLQTIQSSKYKSFVMDTSSVYTNMAMSVFNLSPNLPLTGILPSTPYPSDKAYSWLPTEDIFDSECRLTTDNGQRLLDILSDTQIFPAGELNDEALYYSYLLSTVFITGLEKYATRFCFGKSVCKIIEIANSGTGSEILVVRPGTIVNSLLNIYKSVQYA